VLVSGAAGVHHATIEGGLKYVGAANLESDGGYAKQGHGRTLILAVVGGQRLALTTPRFVATPAPAQTTSVSLLLSANPRNAGTVDECKPLTCRPDATYTKRGATGDETSRFYNH
jgi:hypothetical protein